MLLTAERIRKVHERVGPPAEIVRQRRALYAAAVELSAGSGRPLPSDDVLDNPAVRGHLGAVLGGRERFSVEHLRPVSELVAAGYTTTVEGHPVRLASAVHADRALSGALTRVSGELERHGDENNALRLLTVESGRSLDEAHRLLVEGVRLAVRVAPQLALDLLPHLGLFGVIDARGSARLGSASAREYPGLILVPHPRSALEVAEALVHEGSHQKFFDFGITRAVLGATALQAPRFRSSWAPSGAPPWPLEQSLAAWHAYSALGAFARALESDPESAGLHSDSLLPKAAERAAEIGDWLRGRGRFLGPDAHDLIAGLLGRGPDEPWSPEEPGPAVSAAEEHGGDVIVRPCGSRTLVARKGNPPGLYWVRAERSGLLAER